MEYPFKNYFIPGEDYTLNWNYITSIDEFRKLKECQQPEEFHMEGDAWNHTVSCVAVATEIIKTTCKDWNIPRKRTFMMSMLFHDIGKISTTFKKNGVWHSYNHEIYGERITRRLLWDENIKYRECVCQMVRWHMSRFGFHKSKDLFKTITKLSYCAELDMLGKVFMCDAMGSVPKNSEKRNEDLKMIRLFFETSARLSCLHRPFNTGSYKNARGYLFKNASPFVEPSQEKTLYMLIGLPGAGKDMWITNKLTEEVNVLSRDNIRIKLGLCKEGEKYLGTKDEENKVTSEFNKELQLAFASGKSIAISNINLKAKYRKVIVEDARRNGYYIKYVYVEAPALEDNIERRNGQIEPSVIMNMREKLEWPTPDEYDDMIIEKQAY